MDILRRELNEVYARQHLDLEELPSIAVHGGFDALKSVVCDSGGCYVVTDAAHDHCYVYVGAVGRLMGIADEDFSSEEYDSSDEDVIYNRMHPEDLAQKRLLELEFFRLVDGVAIEKKTKYVAKCRIRIQSPDGRYFYYDNLCKVLRLSPHGKIWLILCGYELSANQRTSADIIPLIMNLADGVYMELPLEEKRDRILSLREKEILRKVKEGKLSKEIASELHISLHTVSRHRQNILDKLNVNNSMEAVMAADQMKLL